MPEWRTEDGTLMIWDPTSHTYVEGPADGGDLAVDRGHASGGDNDLFDPAGGNDGHGDGNLFQPGNPDNNGWLDGHTSRLILGSEDFKPSRQDVTQQQVLEAIAQLGLTIDESKGRDENHFAVVDEEGQYTWLFFHQGLWTGAETYGKNVSKTDDTLTELARLLDSDIYSEHSDEYWALDRKLNPESYDEQALQEEHESRDYKCPNCGSKISPAPSSNWGAEYAENPDTWDLPRAQSGAVTCPNCGWEQTAESRLLPWDGDDGLTLPDHWGSVADPYVCPGCGYATHDNIYECPECKLELVDQEDSPSMPVLEHVAMAMRPEQWTQILSENPYLYHVTEPNRLPSIQQHGLVPGSTVSEKTEGVWNEAGGIPARQGFIYLWATKEGAQHGADWFLGLHNATILTIDASQLDPKLIEADEDYLSDDPQAFVDKHGGPTPEDYYGNTDEYDQGNWAGYDPMQIAGEAGSNWAVEHPKLGDPDVTFESYQGFGDRQDFHGRVAYGGTIPPEAIVDIDRGTTARTAEVAEAPTIAPAMPDINYVLDHNPEDVNESGWYARIWSPNYMDGANNDIGGMSTQKYKDINPTGIWSESFGTWQQCADFLREKWQYQPLLERLAVSAPDEPFEFVWDGGETEKTGFEFMFPVVAQISPLDSKTSKIAMPYHVSPRGNRQEIEQEGLQDMTGAGGIYHWDTPEQAKAYWEWLTESWTPPALRNKSPELPPDIWQFDVPEGIHPYEDDQLAGDLDNYPPKDGVDGFWSEEEGFGGKFAEGLERVPPDKLKRVAMPYHVSPRQNREKIEQEGLHTFDRNHAGQPQDPDGVYYWDKEEQARDFGDRYLAPAEALQSDAPMGQRGRGDMYDLWHFDLNEFDHPEPDAFFDGIDPVNNDDDRAEYGPYFNEDGTPGAHYLPGGYVEPDRLKRVSMAEQTGDPTLDGLIREFAQTMDAERLRDPRNAVGECIYHSEEFAAFLQSRGVDAQIIVLPRNAEWGKTQTMYEDPNYSEEEWKDIGITWNEAPPGATLDELGYQGGDFEDHHAVQVKMNNHTYIVDWTATQYEGQDEVPQIFRADDASWQRNF